MSVADFMSSFPHDAAGDNNNNTTTINAAPLTLEYSMSIDDDDDSAEILSNKDRSQMTHHTIMKSKAHMGQRKMLSCMKNNCQNGLGLNLELVKSIGFQIAAILRLFSMNGLSLIHGGIKP